MFHVKHFAAYRDALLDWQGRVNLVAPSTLPDLEARHFADSAQLAPLIPTGATVADIGSGAGFPGLVLALARPDLVVHLIESDGRKAAFLAHVSRETSAGAVVHAARAQALYSVLAPDVVTARAVAPLAQLCRAVLPWAWANPGLIAVFPKGARWAQEVADARKKFTFGCEAVPSQTAADARILRLTNLCTKPKGA